MTSQPIDPTMSVNELLREHPDAIVALDNHAIDTCCGGDLPLDEAARRANVPLAVLLDEVALAERGAA
jgi:iron-sulfur cluster repair protein YtfE (RIC family)